MIKAIRRLILTGSLLLLAVPLVTIGFAGTFPDGVLANDSMAFSKLDESPPLIVTKSADTNDGVCDSDCSLREAIGASSQDSADEITFDPAVTDPIVLTIGERGPMFVIGKDLTITGPNEIELVISGHIKIEGEATVAISNLTITGGHAPVGGGLFIERNVTAVFTNVIITGNSSASSGGGLFNLGHLTMIQCIISGNSATSAGGISNDGNLTLYESTVSGNFTYGSHTSSSGDGGGISNGEHGVLRLVHSTVVGNTTGFSDLSSVGSGAGIYSTGFLRINNATISNNAAGVPGPNDTGGLGGGIYASGFLKLNYSTITDNKVVDSWNFEGIGGGLYIEDGSTVLGFFGNLIAGNDGGVRGHEDCFGTYTSSGHNLVGEATGCMSDGPGDLIAAPDDVFTLVLDPTLSDNGGETTTHALLPGSPAIDAIAAADCVTTEDQRGHMRPVDGDLDKTAACDIGAYEYGAGSERARAGLAKRAALSGAKPPDHFKLSPNYPNPFNPETRIEYALPKAAHVRLVVYDVLGREVARLVDGPMPAGRHAATWHAGDLPSGLYVYRLTAGAFTQAHTMMLLR